MEDDNLWRGVGLLRDAGAGHCLEFLGRAGQQAFLLGTIGSLPCHHMFPKLRFRGLICYPAVTSPNASDMTSIT